MISNNTQVTSVGKISYRWLPYRDDSTETIHDEAQLLSLQNTKDLQSRSLGGPKGNLEVVIINLELLFYQYLAPRWSRRNGVFNSALELFSAQLTRTAPRKAECVETHVKIKVP